MTRKAWNKGLTAKTSPIIKIVAEKKSKWWKENDTILTREKIGLSSKSREHPKGDKTSNWKGGRRIDKRDGYVLICRPDHPDARKDGSILEHRLIMEQIIGKRLSKNDDVNHINGKKDDNRPENLKLVKHYAHYEEICCPKCDFKFNTK
jgi:hypothetical protein